MDVEHERSVARRFTMKIPTRRTALLLCTLALNLFYLFSPPATAVLGAKRCQQECDAEKAAADAACDDALEAFSDGWQTCRQDARLQFQSCSGSAITCGAGSHDVCFLCNVFTETACEPLESGDEYCYQVYQYLVCDGTPEISPYCY
jgi:hypothetical protein